MTDLLRSPPFCRTLGRTSFHPFKTIICAELFDFLTKWLILLARHALRNVCILLGYLGSHGCPAGWANASWWLVSIDQIPAGAFLPKSSRKSAASYALTPFITLAKTNRVSLIAAYRYSPASLGMAQTSIANLAACSNSRGFSARPLGMRLTP